MKNQTNHLRLCILILCCTQVYCAPESYKVKVGLKADYDSNLPQNTSEYGGALVYPQMDLEWKNPRGFPWMIQGAMVADQMRSERKVKDTSPLLAWSTGPCFKTKHLEFALLGIGEYYGAWNQYHKGEGLVSPSQKWAWGEQMHAAQAQIQWNQKAWQWGIESNYGYRDFGQYISAGEKLQNPENAWVWSEDLKMLYHPHQDENMWAGMSLDMMSHREMAIDSLEAYQKWGVELESEWIWKNTSLTLLQALDTRNALGLMAHPLTQEPMRQNIKQSKTEVKLKQSFGAWSLQPSWSFKKRISNDPSETYNRTIWSFSINWAIKEKVKNEKSDE